MLQHQTQRSLKAAKTAAQIPPWHLEKEQKSRGESQVPNTGTRGQGWVQFGIAESKVCSWGDETKAKE